MSEAMERVNQRLVKREVEIRQLRGEVNRLRRRAGAGRHERILNKAEIDAKTILQCRHVGYPAGRRWFAETGLISQWQYGWALGLLRMARVNDVDVSDIHTLDRAIGAVERTARRLRETGDVKLEELRRYAARSIGWAAIRTHESFVESGAVKCSVELRRRNGLAERHRLHRQSSDQIDGAAGNTLGGPSAGDSTPVLNGPANYGKIVH